MAYSDAHNAYLAYTKQTRPTGRNMGKMLGIDSGVKAPGMELDVLIRWGSRRPMPPAEVTLNEPAAIRNAADKVTAFNLMRANGVAIVPFQEGGTLYDAYQYFGPGSTILGRNRRGMKGRDIVVYEEVGYRDYPTVEQMRSITHEFYSCYVQSTRELRLHVVGDKVVRIQGKYLDYPDQQTNAFVCNYANGYRFRTPRLDLHASRKKAAVDAVKACGLDFGAVDMLLRGNRDSHYVLEVNTAPACSPLTAKCYSAAISLMVESKTQGRVQLAPDLLAVEMRDMPEDTDDEERYIQ